MCGGKNKTVEACSLVFRSVLEKDRVTTHLSAAAFLAHKPADLLICLPGGDRRNQSPEVLPIIQTIKFPPLDPFAQTLEHARGDVLFIRHATRTVAQSLPGKANELLEITPPQSICGCLVASLQSLQPAGD